MKVMILGGDGYLGWPTAMFFAEAMHEVLIVDNMAKRQWEAECSVSPLQPIPSIGQRLGSWNFHRTNPISFNSCDIANNRHLFYKIFEDFLPDVVIHYAEQPSAPYSMKSAEHVCYTQHNNIQGTLNLIMAVLHSKPDCHIIKLGTMGEYGTPNIDIEEGWLDLEHNGRSDRVLYPKKPGSWYHLSKVHDSHNMEFACRVFGLRVTDLNQGVVYGFDTDQTWLHSDLRTSFHYDSIFGTVINRFLVQAAVKKPLTVYGNGSQTRGFLNIRDTLRCVDLAAHNPAGEGEFKVFNQFTEQFSVSELASMVRSVSGSEISFINNPRVEQEDHYYNAKHSALPDLGLDPIYLTKDRLEEMYKAVQLMVDKHDGVLYHLDPDIKWRR